MEKSKLRGHIDRYNTQSPLERDGKDTFVCSSKASALIVVHCVFSRRGTQTSPSFLLFSKKSVSDNGLAPLFCKTISSSSSSLSSSKTIPALPLLFSFSPILWQFIIFFSPGDKSDRRGFFYLNSGLLFTTFNPPKFFPIISKSREKWGRKSCK